MIRIVENKKFFNLYRYWFEKPEKLEGIVNRIIRSKEPYEDSLVICNELSYTVITDLQYSQDQIIKMARKNVRYEIVRAQKEDYQYKSFDFNDLRNDKTILNEFEKAYFRFAKSLDNTVVTNAYSRDKIDSYINNNCFMLSMMSKDSIRIYHAYVFDSNEAVLIYSVSDFRDEKINKSVAGRANKLHHFNDILYFKNKGLRTYDWGNISNKDNPNGIDNFKISFGGEVSRRYNIFIGQGIIGKSLVFAYKIKRYFKI